MCDQHRQTHTGGVAQRNDWKTKHTNTHKQACRVCATQRFVVSSHNKQNMTLWRQYKQYEAASSCIKAHHAHIRDKKNLRFVNIRIHRVMFRFNATIYRLQSVKTTLNWIREKTLSYCILPQTWTWLYLFLHLLDRSFVCFMHFSIWFSS